jgi:hypothetical protein
VPRVLRGSFLAGSFQMRCRGGRRGGRRIGVEVSDGGGSYATHPKDLDVPGATAVAEFACPDLTAFCRLDEPGLEVTG